MAIIVMNNGAWILEDILQRSPLQKQWVATPSSASAVTHSSFVVGLGITQDPMKVGTPFDSIV